MTLLDFVVCDDIRFEQNNKFSLMGIFSDDIIISTIGAPPTWPFPMRLGFFARIVNLDARANTFELRFRIGDKDIGAVSGSINVTHPEKVVSLPIVAHEFPLREGILSFELSILSGATIVETIVLPYQLTVTGKQQPE